MTVRFFFPDFFSPIATLAILAGVLSPGGVSARAAPYADGTGNSLVDTLNEAQLTRHYNGPVYRRGEAAPPARPVDLSVAPSSPQAQPAPAARKSEPARNGYTGSLYYPRAGQERLPAPTPR